MNTKVQRLTSTLFQPVLAAPLGIFRILWGGVMFYYFFILAIGGGKFKYLDTVFHFKYPFFEWVEVLPANIMFIIFWGGVLLSILISLGWYYRWVSRLLFLLYTYTFLLDISFWNNHYYAYMLIGAFFALTDAHRAYSIDQKRLQLDPYVPAWQLYIFQFQFVLIYFFGGLSKLQNRDWIFNHSGYSLLYHNLHDYLSINIIYPLSIILTYGGVLFDLCVGFLLLNRRTLWWCLPFILIFNISNIFLFNIGSFPYAMLGSFVLFIPAAWLAKKVGKLTPFQDLSLTSASSLAIPQNKKKIITAILSTYVIFQLLFPLRSLFYQGSVFWTAEGKLCAWHMMAASSYVKANEFEILEYDDSGKIINNREAIDASKFLSKKQMRTMGTFPFVIPQFARFLKKEAEFAGFKNVEIHGKIYISKNYRPMLLVIDPDVDLASLNCKVLGHNEWILRYQSEDGFFRKQLQSHTQTKH